MGRRLGGASWRQRDAGPHIDSQILVVYTLCIALCVPLSKHCVCHCTYHSVCHCAQHSAITSSEVVIRGFFPLRVLTPLAKSLPLLPLLFFPRELSGSYVQSSCVLTGVLACIFFVLACMWPAFVIQRHEGKRTLITPGSDEPPPAPEMILFLEYWLHHPKFPPRGSFNRVSQSLVPKCIVCFLVFDDPKKQKENQKTPFTRSEGTMETIVLCEVLYPPPPLRE